MNLKKIEKQLMLALTPKRFLHTQNVVKAGEDLGLRYDADLDKIRIAGLLHDCAKNFTEDQLRAYAKEYHLKIDEITILEPQLLHGPVGAIVAAKEYGVDDPQVLDAIAYHTTGRKKMSKLEKIIYLADFIEIGRSYHGVDDLRILAFEDLDKAMIQAFSNTIRYIAGLKGLIHPRTIIARNQLIIKTKKESE